MKRLNLYNGIEAELDDNGVVKIFTSDGALIAKVAEDGKTCKGGMAIVERESIFDYFETIDEKERRLVMEWQHETVASTMRQVKFLARVSKALNDIHYFYRISIIEPSMDRNRRLYFREGDNVAVGMNCLSWKQKAREFCRDYESELGNLEEQSLYYALRIARGDWSLEDVADDSSKIGNYNDAPGATHFIEKTGVRTAGGARDGIGNSSKIVVLDGKKFALWGGDFSCSGEEKPIGNVEYGINEKISIYKCTGTIVLKK